MNFFSPEVLIGRVIGLVIGFTLHEWAHAWTAYRLGDNTAYYQGRLTLSPRAHIEPMGIILALIAGFGWARPVPVNPRAFYPNEKRGLVIVSLAGPLMNLFFALAVGVLIRLLTVGGMFEGQPRILVSSGELIQKGIGTAGALTFVYNVLAIPLAAAGMLNPVIAGAAMALSSVSVVGNSLLLRRWRRGGRGPVAPGQRLPRAAGPSRLPRSMCRPRSPGAQHRSWHGRANRPARVTSAPCSNKMAPMPMSRAPRGSCACRRRPPPPHPALRRVGRPLLAVCQARSVDIGVPVIGLALQIVGAALRQVGAPPRSRPVGSAIA